MQLVLPTSKHSIPQNNAGNETILLAQNAAPKEEKSTNTTVNVDGKGVILKGYDAVAYFKQGKPLKGNPEIASTYQGVTYLFASAANKADFDKDPAKYVPAVWRLLCPWSS